MSAEGAGDRTEDYRQALEAFFAGDGATATEEFAELAAHPGPGQQLAREYLSQPLPEQPEPLLEPTPVGLAAVGAAAVVGAGVYLRRRVAGRRRSGVPGPVVPSQRRAADRTAVTR